MRLIDADDKTLNRKLSYYTCYTGIDEAPYEYATQELDNSPTVPAILIPDNATNGEILCSIFPDMHYTLSEKTPRVVTTIGVASSFDIDWWNSPYKRGKTE